jgi:hypothetical protein
LVGHADVVHQAIEPAERGYRLGDERLRRLRLGEVANDTEGRARVLPRALDASRVAAAHDDARSFGGEQPRGLQADPAGRAGDDADLVAKAEVHRAGVA